MITESVFTLLASMGSTDPRLVGNCLCKAVDVNEQAICRISDGDVKKFKIFAIRDMHNTTINHPIEVEVTCQVEKIEPVAENAPTFTIMPPHWRPAKKGEDPTQPHFDYNQNLGYVCFPPFNKLTDKNCAHRPHGGEE